LAAYPTASASRVSRLWSSQGGGTQGARSWDRHTAWIGVFDLDATGEVVGMRMDAPDELSTPGRWCGCADATISARWLARRPCVVRSFAHAQL